MAYNKVSNKSQDKEVNIIVGESDIHVKTENYKDFFSTLHHVFRNCIDHGIEERQERIDQNKKENATIEIVFKRKNHRTFFSSMVA